MSNIYRLVINNYRGIKSFEQQFTHDFICIIGRGDSGKSTILEAISLVLSPSWTHQFFDNDFYKSDPKDPIVIEVTVGSIPYTLLTEQKFGMYMRGLDKTNGEIFDELQDDHEPVLTIRLEVKKDLEPFWNVVTARDQEPRPISANDRSKLNMFFVADYLDRHFTWSKGGPLYSLLKHLQGDEEHDDSILIEALRGAKSKIDGAEFGRFDAVINRVKVNAERFGTDISKTVSSIDFKDIVIREGKISLHDEAVPFRLKGKGTKRLISMAIQATVAENGGIVLIDEIEQGLEPDRVQQLLSTLKAQNKGQVFITTHSRDVLVELNTTDLYKMTGNATGLVGFPSKLQNVLRANPEGFFGSRIIVAEGATEIGICRAFNEYRISKEKKNLSYQGIKVINGAGNNMFDYAKGFHASVFPVCLFCDSDKTGKDKSNSDADKLGLKGLGIPIFDWDDGECTEVAIFNVVPFPTVKLLFELAANIQVDEKSIELAVAKSQLWDAVKSKFGSGCPASFDETPESSILRITLGSVAHKNGWFKNQDKAYKLGKLLFGCFEQIDNNCKLIKTFEGLSNWIDGIGS